MGVEMRAASSRVLERQEPAFEDAPNRVDFIPLDPNRGSYPVAVEEMFLFRLQRQVEGGGAATL